MKSPQRAVQTAETSRLKSALSCPVVDGVAEPQPYPHVEIGVRSSRFLRTKQSDIEELVSTFDIYSQQNWGECFDIEDQIGEILRAELNLDDGFVLVKDSFLLARREKQPLEQDEAGRLTFHLAVSFSRLVSHQRS